VIYLVDTNVLLRLAQRTHPLHSIARTAVRKLRHGEHQLHIMSQNCIEFWNVATRPTNRNGFGLTPADADRLLRLIERLFPRLPDTPAMYLEWRRLVVTFGVLGVQVHDARLVAVMKTNDVTHILTFNADDFTRFASEGIVAVNPATV
jgi:predicted nucleic acid-binding protein